MAAVVVNGIGQSVVEQLWAGAKGSVFAILDGASVNGLLEQLYKHQPNHECLYGDALKPDMAEVAPYLVELEPENDFTRWVAGQGWGNHWGIFARANAGLHEMRQHLRNYLVVHDHEQQPVYFRFYDPRVLRTYLPTCNAEELAGIFGPVTAFLLEDEKPDTMLVYNLAAGSLKVEKRRLGIT